MEAPWSDGVFTGDTPRDYEEVRIREERKGRISQYWDLLVADQEPQVNRQALLYLMQDLKDEGNTLFKELKYDVAWMHYRNALFIARILETRFYHEVDKEFISTLFSNRAFCCLKKEMYNEAIQDCESAIQINSNNVKAYYRQVLALKAQNRLQDALKVAENGAAIKDGVFKEVVDELRGIISAEKSKTQVSAKDARSIAKEAPDNDWLAGTNVGVTKKSEQKSKVQGKKTKGKANQKQQNINSNSKSKSSPQRNGGLYLSEEEGEEEGLDLGEDSGDSEEAGLSEDEKFVSTFLNVRVDALQSPGRDFHTKVISSNLPNLDLPTSPKGPSASMGLDSFSPPAGKVAGRPDLSQTSGQRASPQKQPQQAPVNQRQDLSTLNPNPQPFVPFAGEEASKLFFPLDSYEFKLGCYQCFVKTGEGVKGYRHIKGAAHDCSQDVLLVKMKGNKVGISWIKVRPRPETKNLHQSAAYKLCVHFGQGHPCKVGEERCTFAHNRAEIELWSMDRDGIFSITDFIMTAKLYNLDTSDKLLAFQHQRSAPPKDPASIPGMNYKTQKPDSGTPTSFTQPAATLPTAQQVMPKPQEAPQRQPLLPTPVRPRMSAPQQMPPYGHPPSNYNYPPPPGPQYGFQQRPHGAPPQGMRFPPPHMMRGRFPPPGQHMDRNFSAPTSQAQIRPNLMKVPVPKPVAQQEDYPQDTTVVKQEFPLRETHDYKLACKECYRAGNLPGVFHYNHSLQHKCGENILIVKAREAYAPWNRIRERKNHRVFAGRYILCNSVNHGNPALCRFGEETCSFAHNKDEQKLWTWEKDEKFEITEFIIQCREQQSQKGYGITEILSRHNGYLSFICKACFYQVPQMINKEGAGGKCSGPAKHLWVDYKILAHFGTEGKVTVINPRGFLHKSAFFKICKWLHFCRNRINAECRFAHSLIERDIWMFERDSGLTQEEIVEQGNKFLGIKSGGPELRTVTTEITPSDTLFQAPDKKVTGAPVPTPSEASSVRVDEDHDELCPYTVQELCQTCWKNGKKSTQDGERDRCIKNHSNWARNRIYLLVPSNKELRPLPLRIPKGFHFIICKYIKDRGKCGYTGSGHCQFAHCQEELEAWQWMCAHDLRTVEDLYKVSKEAQMVRAAASKNKIAGGESVVSVRKSHVPVPMQMSKFSPHYCSYCGKQCNSEKQWEEHCASDRHMFNVNSDKEHQWNYRQPPWGMAAQSYDLCMKHMNGNKCQYSNVPDIYNLCQYAHSQEELDEWRERFEWRQMKREMARQEKVFSFMDELMEQYEEADSGIQVICEEQKDVEILCEQELNIYEEEKNATFLWTFEVRTKRTLNRVALLYNKDRLHFSLLGPDHDQANQIAPGDQFEDVDAKGLPIYRVHVQFTGTMFGSFSQWVIFDFGTMPVLVRKLSVEVGSTNTHDKVRSLREQFQFDRWTSENRRIERFNDQMDDLERKLMNRYKAPGSSESVITQHSIVQELNRNNYQHKMRKLLELEEITRHQIISSYNLIGRLELTNVIQEVTYVYPRPGELFAKVALSEYLSEDTDAGKLILTSVRKVLLAPQSSTGSVVYEAVIVSKENFDYDGRGKDYIYLCLSPGCVSDLGLKHGGNLQVEIQFTMDRMWFCRMHFAIEQLQSTDIVFPDVTKINPMNERQVMKVTSQILNPDQIQAVQHIVTERFGYTPPFVIYGPFGTGKTETLAQAAMVLLKENPSAKILICAQSNSAADLYITKHLDPFLRKSNTSASLRRVYFKDRRVNTVTPEVKKYCLLSPDKASFDCPTAQDIQKHNIVIVTLSTSLLLTDLGLQGYFTHIFVDEAAQALEAETIMPLSLATEKTCIVLAGDHQQISPRVYSQEAQNQRLNMSLLERLYVYYESFSNKIDQTSPLNILLSINYRTKMEILRFISAIFYGGPDKLVSRANLPSVLGITPLMFYAVQGVEVQDSDSISFYNTSEVQEIVERVQELYNQWPTQWGERKAKDIGVVSPYYDQVQLIRKALRKKHPELGMVTVERVNNVQGKEFRALFISTVRTRSLINSPLSGVDQECEGDGGDFGFLSDSKLLNTALTRAQSFVAVVGDPVALCALGDCLNVWRTYLKHCQNMNSINPRSLTLESIKHQVSSLLNSPARERMIQMANQRKQASKPPLVVPVEPAVAPPPPLQVSSWTKKLGVDTSEDTATLENEIVNDLFNTEQLTLDTFTENGKERELSEETVMLQLATEVIRSQKLQEMEEQAKAQGRTPPTDVTVNETINTKLINLKNVDGNVVLTYRESKSDQKEIPELTERYSQSQLEALLLSQGDRYKHCIMNCVSPECIYAEVIDSNSPFSCIMINSRRRCNKAFHGDEVVVEIMPPEEDNLEDENVVGVKVQGQVVGVLYRHKDPSLLVCVADTDNPGLMVPINKGFPRLHNLLTQSQIQRTKKGNVSVYRVSEDGKVTFSQYIKVDPNTAAEKLFVVRFLRWDSRFYHPIGLVIGVVQAGIKTDTGMNILNTENNVRKTYRPETDLEIHTLYPPAYNLPASEYKQCEDFRAKWTFSIGNQGNEEIQTALSIEEMNDGNYVIGVHVADVAHHVIKGGEIDREAKDRGFTLRPLGDSTILMLPPKLSTEVLSLKPNVDRLALSIFLTVSKSGDILQAVPKRCVINSKRNFSFEDVEQILHDPNAASDYLKSCVIVLYHISRIWRHQRLGNASKYQNIGPEKLAMEKLSAEAHLMYEELMIHTNHHVGRLLLENYPDMSPLCCQSAPNITDLESWKQSHAADAINSVGLTKPFLEGSKTCTCKVACTCIINYIRSRSIRIRDSFDIYQMVWNTVCQASDMGDVAFMQNILTSVESHPQLAVALSKLTSIQKQSSYICSSETLDKKHYNLNLAPYVHFTSPLSRYIDICAHRLITCLVENSSIPYTQEEILQICQSFTHKSISNMEYSSAVRSLNLSTALKTKTLTLHPVIENVTDQHFVLCFPSLPDIPESKRTIDLDLLSLSDKPIYDETNQTVQLIWKERIYDPTAQIVPLENGIGAVELNPNRFIFKIPSFHWQKLLISVREENQEKLQQAVHTIRDQLKGTEEDQGTLSEVAVEKTVRGKLKLTSDFSSKLTVGNVVKVQLAAELYNGIITPTVQLLGIANNVDICIQHRSNPVECFTSSGMNASRPNYPDEASYQNAWMPVMDIEAAHTAVSSGNSFTVQNVPLQWRTENVGMTVIYTATFELPIKFMKERLMKIPEDVRFDELFDPSNGRLLESHFSDFICVRCHKVHMPPLSTTHPNLSVATNSEEITWVAHCIVLMAREVKGTLQVKVRLNQSSVLPPPQILHPGSKFPCTIEWIEKSAYHRRIDYALRCVHESSQLSRDIARGRSPVQTVDYRDIDLLRQLPVPGLPSPDSSQDEAIRVAMQQPFCLISGPPGSGKTVTGVRLAYMLAQRNKTFLASGIKPQVLICGPSECSLDVVIEYFKCLGDKCPKVVRIYSEETVQREFPTPSWGMGRRVAVKESLTPAQQDMALHHVIRRPESSFGSSISQFDMLFQLYSDDVTEEQIQEYMATVKKAEVTELREAEILLTTCSYSAAAKLIHNSNVHQIIIDESGGCSEPESMVPICMNRNVKQITLIGDYRQLGPDVHNSLARELGLDKSLFERNADKILNLKKHYRMHKELASVPGKLIYNTEFECGDRKQEAGPSLKIWLGKGQSPSVFCHVSGREERVVTEDLEASYYNQTEVNLAVNIASRLVIGQKVKEDSIVILTRSSCQSHTIKKKITLKGHGGIGVKTVQESQGHGWDYVILSTTRSMPKSGVEVQPDQTWVDKHLGVLADKHYINLAITRAREGLIIVGNKHLLQVNALWNRIIEVYEKDGRLVDGQDYLRNLS